MKWTGTQKEHVMAASEPLQVVHVVTEQVVENYAPILRHLCVGMIDEAISVTVVSTTPRLENLFVGPVNIVYHKYRRWFRGKRVLEALAERIPGTPRIVHTLDAQAFRLSCELAAHWKADLVALVAGFEDIQAYTRGGVYEVSSLPAFTEPLVATSNERASGAGSLTQLIRPGIHALKAPTCFTSTEQIPTLLVRGPLVSGCGITEVLEAVARLVDEKVALMLFVLGSGPRESSFRRRVEELKIGPYVTFAGDVREWSKVLSGADIFIQTRPTTSFEVHALEAMATGMAVVACPDGVEDYFQDDQTVLLALPAGVEGFYRCLRRLLDDPGYARTLAGNAQRYVRAHHQPSAMVAGYAELYRRLALKRRTIPLPTRTNSS